MRVRILLLLASLFALAAVSRAEEIALSPPVIAPQTSVQSRPGLAVAAAPDSFLVAWEERTMSAWPNTSTLVFRTFRSDGEPLEPAFVPIGVYNTPKAVWTGDGYFIVFSYNISRFGSIAPIRAIGGIRVTEDGHIVPNSEVVLLKYTSAISANDVAYAAGHVMVASTSLVIATLDGSSIATVPVEGTRLGITSDGSRFYVLLSTSSGIVLDTVSIDGRVVDQKKLSSDTAFTGSVSPNGASVAAIWLTNSAVYGTAAAGDTAPAMLIPAASSFDSFAWDGSAWNVAWQTAPSVCRARLIGGGKPLSVCDAVTANREYFGRAIIVSNSARTALAWSEKSGTGDDAYDVVRFSTDVAGRLPQAQYGQTISLAAQTQFSPAAVSDGSGGMIVAWSEWVAVARRWDIRIGGITADGVVRPDWFVAMKGTMPRMARGGGSSLLVWASQLTSTPEVLGARVDDSAHVIQLFDFGGGTAPHVAWSGREWLVVWQSPQTAEGQSRILATAVTANGTVVSPHGIGIDSTAFHQFSPSVDWSGKGFVVTWCEYDPAPPAARVASRLLDHSGTPISGRLVVSSLEGFTLFGGGPPTTTTCGESTCLVTWIRPGTRYGGAQIAPDASSASEPFTIMPYAFSPYYTEPAVLPIGRSFAFYWLADFDWPLQQFIIDGSAVTSVRPVARAAPSGVAATMIGTTPWVVYSRATTAEEMMGGAVRVFAAPVGPLKSRAARP